MDPFALSPLSKKLIKVLEKDTPIERGEKVSVDQVVTEVASFYEKIRNAMEYQEEEVVFRAAIERILRRKLLFESSGKKIAPSLIKELAWAKYFPDKTIPSALIETIGERIDLYIKLYREVVRRYKLNREHLYGWFLEVMSADLAFAISPNRDVQILSNFMFHIFQKKVSIDDTEEVRDALVFVSCKRALAKEDRAFLRFHLFEQYFSKLTKESEEEILGEFASGYKKIEQLFKHPLNDKVFNFVKRRSVPFIIMRDVFRESKGQVEVLVKDPDRFAGSVLRVCDKQYRDIYKKARTGVIRSVIFLFATKAVLALVIEGNFERFFYHQVYWQSLAMNTIIPPLIMLSALLFIRIPDRDNSLKILEKIKSILFDPNIGEIEEKAFSTRSQRNPVMYGVFIVLWLFALYIVTTKIIDLLSLLHSNPISEGVFMVFLILVSFLAFRISQTAKIYKVTDDKENFISVIFDFLFMPFIHLGQRLTLTVSKLNIFMIIFDFVIETPFKTLFAFMEQWFSFLRSQREVLE